MEGEKTHVAFLPSPGMGHIIPVLEFAKQLVTIHGFHVSFITFSTGSSPAQTELLNSPSIPSDIQMISLPRIQLPDTFSYDTNMHPAVKVGFIVTETIKKFLKSTLLSIPYGLPKALLTDAFCVSAFDIGKEVAVPTFILFTGPPSIIAWLIYFPTFDQSVNGDYTDLPETIQTPGCDCALLVKDLIGTMMIREGIPDFKRFVEADGILINTWEDLEKSTVFALRKDPFFVNLKTPPIYPIGPLIKSKSNSNGDHDENSIECLKWLDDQPKNSVLFVSFGSAGTLTNEQIFEIAYGLEQSKQRFIWVVRKPSNVTKSGSFFNVGIDDDDPKSYLPNRFLEKVETFGKILTNWAPQMEVLSHESTGGFLTHCGWNSVLESIINCVPMICWPLFADQMVIASMISNEHGVGARVAMENDVVGRDEVERVVRKVMEGEEGKVMRRRASVLQESALKSQVGASFDTISSLVQTWKLEKQP